MRRTEDGLNFNIVLPIALLLVLLLVPFSINFFIHIVSAEKQRATPLVMKLPVDNTAIVAPSEIKQYERFQVSLHLDTKKLAGLINEIGAMATTGTHIQGIVGVVSPEMKAEITGEDFIIDEQGPQEQLYIFNEETRWTWHMVSESSGRHTIKFYLHLLTYDNGKAVPAIIDVADVNMVVNASPSEWMARNWGWIVGLLALVIIGWQFRYRFIVRD